MIWAFYGFMFLLFLVTTFWYAYASAPLKDLLLEDMSQFKRQQEQKYSRKTAKT